MLELTPDAGPPDPPASAARCGLYRDACLRYAFDVHEDAAATLPWLDELRGRTVAPGDVLVWAVHPALAAWADGDPLSAFRAAQVAVEVRGADGRSLLAATPVETDGSPTAAAARADWDFPEQWNERRVPLGALAGSQIASVELVAAPVGEGGTPTGTPTGTLTGWVDLRGIEPGADAAASALPGVGPAARVGDVDTRRGTHSSPRHSRGLTQPLAGVPHGSAHLAPATDLARWNWTYSWNAHGPGPHPALAGMLITRAPSIWIGDRGALAVRIGRDAAPSPEFVRREEFSHDDEQAHPHRYRVRTLAGTSIDAAGDDRGFRIDAHLPAGGAIAFTGLAAAALDYLRTPATAPGSVRATFSTVAPGHHARGQLRAYYEVQVAGPDLTAQRSGDALVVRVGPGAVAVSIGTSQLSIAQASAARGAVAGLPVDALAAAAATRWDELLGTVEVGTGEVGTVEAGAGAADAVARQAVASDLYRLFAFPTRHDEQTPAGPRYPSPTRRVGRDRPRETGRRVQTGRMLTDNGFWDTYRTAWPAYALLAPGRAGAMLDGMLEHVRDAGWSPRWTAGVPLDAMVGTSLDVVSADLVAAGVAGVDLETAAQAALRNATAGSADPRFGRRDMPEALRRGWVSATTDESVSWTIEGAISDGAAAALWREVARRHPGDVDARANARLLAHRARAYRHLWDAATGFVRPRTAAGAFADEPFDPRQWGGAHTETNAWTSRFAAPHDGAALAALFGGPAALGDALDAYFTTPETATRAVAGGYHRVIHEMVEARDVRRGMWGLSNQPAHHVPWLYAHTDRPWRTDEVVTDACRRMFRGATIGQGYPGDEDNGEMSAWRLLSTLGFAPYQPGSGMMLVTAPQVARLTIAPLGGERLEVETVRTGGDARFIRRVTRDGAEWTSPQIALARLREGGRWRVELGAEPVRWAEPLPAEPYFQPDGVHGVDLRDATGAVRAPRRGLFRRGGALHRGDVVEVDLDVPVPASTGPRDAALLVLCLRDPGIHAFTVTTHGPAGETVVREVRDAAWPWPRQARPFEVALPAGTRRVTVRWLSASAALDFAQVLVPA